MVGGDVQQDGNVGAEAVHVVELEAGEFQDVVVELCALGYLEGKTAADVPGQPYVVARALEDVIDERRGGCLAVAARYADHLGLRVARGKLYFGNDGDALGARLGDDGRVLGDSGALDDLPGCEDGAFGVPPFFPADSFGIEHFFVLALYRAAVGDKGVHAFPFGQDGRPRAAFAGS